MWVMMMVLTWTDRTRGIAAGLCVISTNQGLEASWSTGFLAVLVTDFMFEVPLYHSISLAQ